MDLKRSFCRTGNRRLRVVIGDRYGLLTIIADVFGVRPRRVLVKCECGNVKNYALSYLRHNEVSSCGCTRNESRKYVRRDFSNCRFGRLVVLRNADDMGYARTVICKCDCGNEVRVRLASLRNKTTQSCGCLKKERVSEARLARLIGKRFGKLVVIKRAKNNQKSAMSRWHCECDCGNTTVVYVSSLRDGSVKSCDCGQGGGKSTPWTTENEIELINLLNAKIKRIEISEKIKRTRPAISKRLEFMRREKNLNRCEADDCQKYFFAKMSTAKYCSDQCRWRESKRSRVEKRRKEGLCPQCGRVPIKRGQPYCKKCKDYFNKRYREGKDNEA